MSYSESEHVSCFISCGALDRMYTLRVNVLRPAIDGKMYLTDVYWCNLATDWNRATEKAERYAEELGLPLYGEVFCLDEIRRSKEKLDRETKERISRETQEAADRSRKERQEEYEANLVCGVFLCGKHTGKTAPEVAEKDLDYIFYMSKQEISDDEIGKFPAIVRLCRKYLEENVKFGELPEYEVGEKFTINARITGCIEIQGTYGWQSLIKLFSDDGVKYACYTTSKKILDNVDLKDNEYRKFEMCFYRIKDDTVFGKKIKLAK